MTEHVKATQDDADKNFITLADSFIELANEKSNNSDPQLINASMLYATARYSAFITASLSESKESYEQSTDQAIDFFMDEFKKMLQEHMNQYKSTFKQETPPYPY